MNLKQRPQCRLTTISSIKHNTPTMASTRNEYHFIFTHWPLTKPHCYHPGFTFWLNAITLQVIKRQQTGWRPEQQLTRHIHQLTITRFNSLREALIYCIGPKSADTGINWQLTGTNLATGSFRRTTTAAAESWLATRLNFGSKQRPDVLYYSCLESNQQRPPSGARSEWCAATLGIW